MPQKTRENYLGRVDGQSRYAALICGHSVRDPETKKCINCNPKPASPKKQFCPNGHDTFVTGRNENRVCIVCKREEWVDWSRRTKYGITSQEYHKLVDSQNGNCSICHNYFGDKLVIDHDHDTGKVRKLLCQRCNTFLGYIEKSGLELIRHALDYLSE